MLSEAIYFVLVSNLEHHDGQEALIHRGLPLNYTGKGTWGFVPIHTEDHWFDLYMMLIDAVDSERNTALDTLLTLIESSPVALR